MKDKPLVSIVTPSYNQGRFIEDTILSVKNQDYPNIEHIVVDGGSTDNTLEILRKYENEYNLRWISEPDEGQSDAMNKGLRMAKGEIIGWLNSDDVYFTRDVISYVVEKFNFYRNADVIYGDNVVIDQNNFILRFRRHLPVISRSRLLRVNHIVHPAAFVRMKALNNFLFQKKYNYAMDYDMWLYLKIKNFSNFKHVNKIIVANRHHASAKTISKSNEMREELNEIRKKYGQTIDIKYKILTLFDTFLLGFYRFIAFSYLLSVVMDRNNRCFAFEPKFNPLFYMILNQLFYPFPLKHPLIRK